MANFVNLLLAKNFLCTFKVQTTKVQTTNRARIQRSNMRIARLIQHLIETLSVLRRIWKAMPRWI
jgi:hypothetical protein